jgi:hypothetical protein
MAGTSRPCQRYSRGPAKLKDGFRIMFRLLYTASDRVAKRAGFCVDCWLRSLLATPLRYNRLHQYCLIMAARELSRKSPKSLRHDRVCFCAAPANTWGKQIEEL